MRSAPRGTLFGRFQKGLGSCDLHHDGLTLAFAALRQPGGQALGEAFSSEAEAGLDFAIGHG